MKSWEVPLAAFSCLGFVLSAASHLASFLGSQGPLGSYAAALHLGIFFVWFPVAYIANKQAGGHTSLGAWKVLLRNCPPWMRLLTYATFAYAIVNFLIFAVLHRNSTRSSGPMPADIVQGFSGHWMFFYAAGAAILYSAAKRPDDQEAPLHRR
jgi:hypothetical protein